MTVAKRMIHFVLASWQRLAQSRAVSAVFGRLPQPVQRRLQQQRFFFYAVLVHVAFVLIFTLSFEWTVEPVATPPKVNVIDAVVVDESRVQAELEKLKQAEQRRATQDQAREKKLRQEEQRLAELKKQKAQEQKRLKEQQLQRQQEEKKAKELALKKKTETERLEKLKQEQQALEKQRQQEQQKLAELEQQRQQEAERLRQQQEAEKRLQAEKALQEQLVAEQKMLAAERERQAQGEVNRYVEIIKQKVTRNWLKPGTTISGLSCVVMVNLIPGGDVLSVRIIKSSGDPVFDRSVETAVLKASPLPLPPDAALFERFRELKFVFNPEG